MKLIELREDVILVERDLLLEMSREDVQKFITIVSTMFHNIGDIVFKNKAGNIIKQFVPNVIFNCTYHFSTERVMDTSRPERNLPVEVLINMFKKVLGKSNKTRLFTFPTVPDHQAWVLKDTKNQANVILTVNHIPKTTNYTMDCVTVRKKPCMGFKSDDYPKSIDIWLS